MENPDISLECPVLLIREMDYAIFYSTFEAFPIVIFKSVIII